jgi:5-methylcytosine-specific restriction endonuclease McrA
VSPLVSLCPGCGGLHTGTGRCSRCRRIDSRERYHTEPIRQLRSTARYRRQRDAAKRRDGYRCQVCGATENLEAHHIVPLEHGGNPLALDNLVTLCSSCHRRQPTFFEERADSRPPAEREFRPEAAETG